MSLHSAYMISMTVSQDYILYLYIVFFDYFFELRAVSAKVNDESESGCFIAYKVCVCLQQPLPLFPSVLGFDLMYAGIFLMYGNLLTGAFTLFAVIMLHLQILQEEIYLDEMFGEVYRNYKKHVRRYLGKRREKR